jgi:hypothetical protein
MLSSLRHRDRPDGRSAWIKDNKERRLSAVPPLAPGTAGLVAMARRRSGDL